MSPDAPNAFRRVYGFCGFIGSGKNTAARAIADRYPFNTHVHSFAAPLKDAVAAIFGWNRNLLEGTTLESRQWREQPDHYWSEELGKHFTPRLALQEIGTNVFRNYYENIWIAASAKRADKPGAHIFTDCRFGNELRWLNDTDGLTMWIYRPNPVSLSPEGQQAVAKIVEDAAPLFLRDPQRDLHTAPALDFMWQEKAHASETAFLIEGAPQIHIVVSNTGDAGDLYRLIEHVDVLCARGELTIFPLGARTLYLDYDNDGPFRWRYRIDSKVFVKRYTITHEYDYASYS
tara:strand:- start:180 stop:1046 length:867 start_codon:yes stop_codon:yes gene_type:complete